MGCAAWVGGGGAVCAPCESARCLLMSFSGSLCSTILQQQPMHHFHTSGLTVLADGFSLICLVCGTAPLCVDRLTSHLDIECSWRVLAALALCWPPAPGHGEVGDGAGCCAWGQILSRVLHVCLRSQGFHSVCVDLHGRGALDSVLGRKGFQQI